MDSATARTHLKDKGLRSTSSRLIVLQGLAESPHPVSYRELASRLGTNRLDPVTVYRNLKRLAEVGLARIASRAGGRTRYELSATTQPRHRRHPHFACHRCGALICLDANVIMETQDSAWRTALRSAEVQLEGICPDCQE
jgi:Fe2+ or Zn2+ uptake regulation protein